MSELIVDLQRHGGALGKAAADEIERLEAERDKYKIEAHQLTEERDEIERIEREYDTKCDQLEAEIARKDEVIRCLIVRFWNDGPLFISKTLEQNGFINNEFTTQDQDNER